jgi:hypothetical protein
VNLSKISTIREDRFMSVEYANVYLLDINNTILESMLSIYEEYPEDIEQVFLEIHYSTKKIGKSADDFFSAMQAIRKELELEGILMLCNGAARNVYPSPMQRNGRTAYILEQGCPAKLSNTVDIFEKSEELDFVNVEEQDRFYYYWIQSLQKHGGE